MALADRVRVVRRYQRSIRINADLNDNSALQGFVCPRSSADALETMASHILEGGQGAFTWTGPYGSGKSSLVIALSAALSGRQDRRREAGSILGQETASLLWQAMPPRKRGWRILPVVGRQESPVAVLGAAIEKARMVGKNKPRRWDESSILEVLQRNARRYPRVGGGLIVFIDEMGKLLEAAAGEGSDIYLFQQMAEVASRSGGRLIVVGVLHQAFEEYANRMSRDMRDEWSKIQGRFVDLVINAGGDEQIDLLSRAIETDRGEVDPGDTARGVARLFRRNASSRLPDALENCWPLHPVVACLLGPMSRRRFGQNQRSIFSFLNSAEPCGFQEFLRSATGSGVYGVERFWDYLRTNLEPAILASPDGHRWAVAVNVLDRCEAMGGDELHIRLLKVIAAVDMLKDHSGLSASRDLLALALPDFDLGEIKAALADLESWRLVAFRKFRSAYALFEGSDFDIDRATERALEESRALDFSAFEGFPRLQPIVAKRHYHDTGALRWFDVMVVSAAQAGVAASEYSPKHGAIGAFLLAIPTEGETEEVAHEACRIAARGSDGWEIVVGLAGSARSIPPLLRELLALQRVREHTPELQGDKVARMEVRSRIAALQARLDAEVAKSFDGARWYYRDNQPKRLRQPELNSFASSIADRRFESGPVLRNELVMRDKPSSSAVAARNSLLRRMALRESEPRLGISGFPAEGGLYVSLLEATGLHAETEDGWRFVPPPGKPNDQHKLAPAWQAAIDFLKRNSRRAVSLSEIYDIWEAPPFGIKKGLLPVIGVAFVLSQSRSLAFYRDAIFQARISDLDIDFLVRDARDIQLRWMDLSQESRSLLSAMAGIVRDFDERNALIHLEPIDVAKGLVAIYDRLPPWVGRTQRLSGAAKRLRQLFKQANDPNKLVFDDIPEVMRVAASPDGDESVETLSSNVRDAIAELQQVYPAMLNRLKDLLLAELEAPNASPATLAELRERADNVRELGGDHRLEAFVVRLAAFHGSDTDIEGLAGMAASKPTQLWTDADIDRAEVELADLSQRFKRAESFARVKGRRDKRHAMAVIVGMDGRPAALHDEFHVSDRDHKEVDSLIEKVDGTLRQSGVERRNIILAALAELSARYLDPRKQAESKPSDEERKAVS